MPIGEVLRGALDQFGLVLAAIKIDRIFHSHPYLACAVVTNDEDRQQGSAGDPGQPGRAARKFNGRLADSRTHEQLTLPGASMNEARRLLRQGKFASITAGAW
ncbi:MAG: hypothetical protein E5X09_18365, partial [Mesorhizobium sp.]